MQHYLASTQIIFVVHIVVQFGLLGACQTNALVGRGSLLQLPSKRGTLNIVYGAVHALPCQTITSNHNQGSYQAPVLVP